MNHTPTSDDQAFRRHFETGGIGPGEFDHQGHLRLAYVVLCECEPEVAHERVRASLHAFLERHELDPTKYHETLTRSWILAVRHFMERTPGTSSFEAFLERNPVMLDTGIMLTHYREATLFSGEAREGFVEPDLDPIPRYEP